MEKSMIQDLDAMRTSLGYRNTFTTSFHDGGYQLKKSKISNLPSYKKSDLSVKLPFVVVFQTMQIQRLSEQIEALRIALKDSERQAFNCQSYQIQIRQLTDQCHEYDVELLEYKEEIQKLNAISQKLYEELEQWRQKYEHFDPAITDKYKAKNQECQALENEITKWRDRYRALENSKDRQMEDLKLAMECQRKSVLDREIRQLTLKFDSERSYLTGQIRKMQEAEDQRQTELTQAKFEAEALRIENQVNIDANRKLKQSQNKLNRITEELVRLNQVLRRKQEEISRKDANQDYLKELIKSSEREKLNHQNEAIKVPQLEAAIKQWIVKFSRLQNENNEWKEQLQKMPLLERDLQDCTAEISRLTILVKGKMQQLAQANTKTEKMKSLYEQSRKSEEKVPSLERRITQMGYEAERLNDILKKRLIEVEQGKNRITALQRALRIFEQAQPEKKRVEEQLRKQVRQVEKQKKEIKQLQKELRKIPQIQAVLADERNVREEYIREVDRLNKFVKEKNDESETLNHKISHLENKMIQFANIEAELNSYKSQNNRMVQQIDMMNNRIREKCEQLEFLVNQIETLHLNFEKYKEVEQKLIESIGSAEKLTAQLNQVKSELKDCQQSLLKQEGQLREAQNTIIEINSDRQMLNRNLSIKNQQLQQAEIEINEQAKQIQELKEVERRFHELQQQMRTTQVRMREAEDAIRKYQARNDELQYQLQCSINQIEKMRTNGYFPEEFRLAFKNIQANAYEKQKEYENLIKKQITIEKCAEQIKEMISKVCFDLKAKNSDWSEINAKIQDSLRHVHRIAELQDQNTDLRTQNLQLESQIKILNLEILEAQVRKNANPGQVPAPSVSTSSWSFNTVPSKKAIDSVVQEQTTSRVSALSNQKRVLGSSGNLNNENAMSRAKLEEVKSASKISANKPSANAYTVSQNYYQPIQNQSTISINSSRGISPSVINSYFPSPSSKISSASKQATETYYTMKTSKTSSVREPYTFMSSYRA